MIVKEIDENIFEDFLSRIESNKQIYYAIHKYFYAFNNFLTYDIVYYDVNNLRWTVIDTKIYKYFFNDINFYFGVDIS